MTAFDYPITETYGYHADYPLNNGFHNGVDYGCPIGTPIVINGVQIGVSGATGAVSGQHLHVGHIVGGSPGPISPQDGRNVSGARVTEINEDATNGKYVRLADADGTNWVYLHMSNNHVLNVGDVLANLPKYNESKKEDTPMPNDGDIINLKRLETGVQDYQPPGSELDHYKDPKFGWKALAYDTAKGMQVQVDLAKMNTGGEAQKKIDEIKSILG